MNGVTIANNPEFVATCDEMANRKPEQYFDAAVRAMTAETRVIAEKLPPDSPAKKKLLRRIECVEYPDVVDRVERLLARMTDESDTYHNIIDPEEQSDLIHVLEMAKTYRAKTAS